MKLFYDELAEWWPVISPVEEYAGEAAEILRVIRARRPHARTLLELGSGGGHIAHYLARSFECCLTDLSPAMLDVSRRLNPQCEHTLGDMRSLDLGRTFDVVLAHDAIDYMTSAHDLQRAFDTAFRHLAPGGLALFVPDAVAETFEPGTDVSGSDAPDGRAARLFEWVEPACADDPVVAVHYTFLLRDRDGAVRSYYERHDAGRFPRATWQQLLAATGFIVDTVTEETDDDRMPRDFFLGEKPQVSRSSVPSGYADASSSDGPDRPDSPDAYCAGSLMPIVVPPDEGQSTEMSPPWASTMRLTVGRPRPDPRALVVKNGSNMRCRTSGGMPGPVSDTEMRHESLSASRRTSR